MTLRYLFWSLICSILLCTSSCIYKNPQITQTLDNAHWHAMERPPSPSPPQSPPEGYKFDKKLYLVIQSNPSNVKVYTTRIIEEGKMVVDKEIGVTPIEIEFNFCEWNNILWFKDPDILGGTVWSPAEEIYQTHKELYNNITNERIYQQKKILGSPYYYPLQTWWGGILIGRTPDEVERAFSSIPTWDEYLETININLPIKRDITFYFDSNEVYGTWATTYFQLFYKTTEGEKPEVRYKIDSGILYDGHKIKPAGFPINLVQHGRVFAKKLGEAINQEDYYGAEELRLSRIRELEDRLEENKKWDKLSDNRTSTGLVQVELMNSELDRLRHLVGLLDPQLMALRKQLLAKLHDGDVNAAFGLAEAVSAMEKRYFSEPPPRQIIVQVPNQASAQPTIVTQDQGKQELIIQQKPYYGVQNIVQALGAMRSDKINPETFQKSLGTAQLLDIMGIAETLNK